MNHSRDYLKYFGLAFVVLIVAACGGNKHGHESGAKDTLSQNGIRALTGTYEYSEPIDESYLYFKIEVSQKEDSVTGRLWGGVYLAKSEAGGYTNPNVTTECVLKGAVKDDVIEMQITETKTTILEEEAPDLLGMMNFPQLESDVTVTIWGFIFENGALVSQNGLLMPDGTTPVKFVWEKIK